MIKRLILFLIRLRLGVRKYEDFIFNNQKSESVYFFAKTGIVKATLSPKREFIFKPSSVSLNWLLDDECHITKIKL